MNKMTSATLGLSLAAALAAPASGAIFQDRAPTGAHYRQGFGDPVCSISGLTVSCSGTEIAGVGNNDATVMLAVTYGATVQCRNNEIRNGTLVVAPFSASNPPTNATFLALATCPNPNWTKVLLGTPTVTGYTYTLTFEGYTLPAITVSYP